MPGGTPASMNSSASRIGTTGSRSDGLRMKALPQAIAGAGFHSGIIAGKLNGVVPDADGHASDEAADHIGPQVALGVLGVVWFIGVVRDGSGRGRIGLRDCVPWQPVGVRRHDVVRWRLRHWLLFTAEDDAIAATQPGIWAFGRRLTNTLLNVYAMRMAAVFIMATTTLAVRLRLIPAGSPSSAISRRPRCP